MIRCAVCVLLFAVSIGRSAAANEKPNFLITMADDQTFHDAGCYGNDQVHTPNINRLASKGLLFTHAFTSTAMCAPTRQQLYTGLFPVRNGAYPNHSKVYPGTKSIVHHLKKLGYRVGLCGKRHFGPPASFPFEMVAQDKLDEFVTRDAEKPFCLIYTSNSPHLPWTEGDASQYDPAKFKLPPYLVDTPQTRQALAGYYAEITDFDREVGQCMQLLHNAGLEDDTVFICTSEQGAQFPHCKWTCYDAGLHTGLVIRWPKRIKPGKTDAMVQYVDVLPTLIALAGGDPESIDCGRPSVDGKTGFDGQSFADVLTGKSRTHRDVVYGVHTTRGIINGSPSYPIRSIRTKTHKLIWNPQYEAPFRCIVMGGRDRGGYWLSWVEKAKSDARARKLVDAYSNRPEFELYDLQADPYELDNVAERSELQSLRKRLHRDLKTWMASQGDEGIATELKAFERQGKRRNARNAGN